MNKIYSEPLFHFLVLGVLIFVLFSIVSKEDPAIDGKKIVVSAEDTERLSTNWSKKWNRSPTDKELQGLVESYIREEVYYREALALGLDQNDTVLRRRLMQKMEFLSNDLAELNPPDETALNEYFRKHQDKYELPARISFTHIYFSPDKRGRQAFQDADNILNDIRTTSPSVTRAPDRGDPFMLPYDFINETPFEVARLFGLRFAKKLFQSGTDGWQGPIESAYGLHLVWINKKNDARIPELASVIDKVRTDWMFEQRQKTNQAIYEKFKQRYEIVVEMPNQLTMEKTATDRKSS